ncbi:tandem large repeat [Vibrio coralliilyticus]|uniref:tandem large repeat n=1 Tax=Vibrio coralliilyticus TaxID=190893 RepID=UPI002409DD68|nr:tandem large repeat [Vibrio coralliilyticus]WFB50705.1 tandem large repeat [Vibrio coralliilyticus]
MQRHIGTMLVYKNIAKLFLTILVILSLSSCGGGGGGDSSPRARDKGTISGIVFDAPVSQAVVTAYEYQNGKVGRKLGSTTTSPYGEYSIEVDASSMPLYIEAKGGAYMDPLSEKIVETSLNKPIYMASVLNYGEGNDQQVMITPLTHMVAGLAEYKIKHNADAAAAIDDSLNTINSMYGFNVNSVSPIDITKGGQSSTATDGHKYGALLTAYSSYAYDFLLTDEHGGDVYTSMNLSDIGYRDIAADGLLNGQELDSSGSFEKSISFGIEPVTADVYTNAMARHLLIVVSDPSLNVSKTPIEDYQLMAEHLNNLGTGSDGGVIPDREPEEIDEHAPTATRQGTEVLKGTEAIDIILADEVGVSSAVVTLEYNSGDAFSGWESFPCDVAPTNQDAICWVDTTDFEQGPRETSLKVYVDTEALDNGDPEASPQAYLSVVATDVLGNTNSSGSRIDFEWDNIAPVIEVTSPETINSETKEYVLTGFVKEDPDLLEGRSVYVAVGTGLEIGFECRSVVGGDGSKWCEFTTDGYETSGFGDSVDFNIRADDIYGNSGSLVFTLYYDSLPPKLFITYPNQEFNFETEDGENKTMSYTDYVYDSVSVETATNYLQIAYEFASDGLNATIDDLDFTDFFPSVLVDESVPYVEVEIRDSSEGGSYSSSADDLTFNVAYYRKRNQDDEYDHYITKTERASEVEAGNNTGIPFKKLVEDANGKVGSMTYYVPYVKELFSTYFSSAVSGDRQMLEITASDPSGNVSKPQRVYFRSTFDMPEVTVVTPFINASVNLEGLTSSGRFNPISSCTTNQVEGATDLATCTIPYKADDYEFFRVYLKNKGNTGAYYYQWSEEERKDVVFPEDAVIGAYYTGSENKTLYITEFSTYQTGLFDSQWDQLSEKSTVAAIETLADVNDAIAEQPNSMLGFDPITTRYATNEMLEGEIPTKPNDEYIYRFLLESLFDMAEGSGSGASSLDYAIAFYKDLSADGVANGQDASGQIYVGSKKLTADTYRSELAQAYYDLVTSEYEVDSIIALEQADHFAKAYPRLDGTPIFDERGESIDQEAPSVDVTPTEGTFVQDGVDYTFSGTVLSTATVEDLAGVDTTRTEFEAYWYDNTLKKNEATNVIFELQESDDEYQKIYEFTIDSLSSEYPNVEYFDIVTTAYDNIGNVYGPATVSRYYVDNQPPTGAIQDVDPKYPTHDETVTFQILFDEPVTAVAATFDDIDIDFGESKDFKELWTGTTSEVISLNPDENSKKLVVSAYHDELNNIGEAFSEDVIVTPTITIDDVTEDNEVNSADDNVNNISFSGSTTGFLKDSELSVNVVSDKRPNIDKFEFTEVKVNQEGVWSISNQDMSSWEESDFTIEVTGRNSEESEYVVEEKESKYVDSIAPEVIQSQISMSGSAVTLLPANSEEVLIDGEIATVTLTFSERVSQPESLLNGQLITFNQPADGDVAKTWVGTSPELVLPESESTSKLVVTNYTDTAGEPNSGAPYEKTVDVKPIILMQDISDLTTNEARDFVVSGTARGFENSAQLRVVVSSSSPLGEDFNETVEVTNGAWTTTPEDISSWESGTLTITVDGSNSGGQEAEASQDVELLDDIAPTVGDIIVNSGGPIIDNQTAFVSVTFSERVENVVADVDGVKVNFVSRNGAKTVWEGTTSGVVTLNANEMFKTVTVTEYQDAQGNSGEEGSIEAPVKPLIEITERGDSIDEDESRRVVISGTARGFKTGDTVRVVAHLADDPSNYNFDETRVVAEDGAWATSEQNIRDWPSGDINLTVIGQNNNGVAADSAKDTITYEDATPPTVDGEIVFSPEVPVDGEKVTITVNFSELVTGVTATVGGVDVTFTGDEPAQQWVGETEGPVTLSSNEDTITAVVNRGYQDLSGNEADSDKETATGVKPIILLSDIEDLTTTEARDFVVSGTARGFENNAQLRVVVSSDNPINEDEELNLTAKVTNGIWTTAPEDISSWESGTLTITVDGSNGGGQAAEQASQEVELEDDIEPKVNGITVNSGDPIIDNQTAFVSLTFSERVENVVANVDGVDVTFTSRDAAKTVWEGTTSEVVALNANEMFKTVTVTEYQDAQGNMGQVDSIEAPVKPLIEITERGDSIGEDESSRVVISGTARGFQAGDTVRVVAQLADDPSNYNFDETRVVAEDGAWATSEQNIRDWPSGDINLTVVGQNNNGVVADSAKDTITYEDATPPTVDGEIVFSPEFPVDGQNVTITVNFSELVTGVTATVGGVGVTFTGDEPAQQWVGETEGPVTLSSNEDTITAVVNRGYQDLSGNEAGSDKETATGVKPVLSLDTVEDNNQIDSQEAEHVVIHGTGIGFAGDSQMITVTVTSQKESSFNWQETVSISEDGVWTTNSSGQDMSDWPLGLITVEATGLNQKGIAAEPVMNDKVSIVDTLPPNVTRVESLTPSEPEFDSTVGLTINFDEPVKELSGTFAGVPMNFTKVGMIGELSDQWMAETESGIDLTAGSATEEFILNTFEDASGNAAVREYKESFFVKPLIEIDSVTGDNVIESDEISEFYITGQSKGIEHNGTLTVKVKRNFSTKLDEVVTVESDGSWSTGKINASSWNTGDFNVQVTGKNNGNVSANEATQTITIQ